MLGFKSEYSIVLPKEGKKEYDSILSTSGSDEY